MNNQLCFLCNKEIKNYKHNEKKVVICEFCTMELCKNLPRKNSETLEIMKAAIEFNKTLSMEKM